MVNRLCCVAAVLACLGIAGSIQAGDFPNFNHRSVIKVILPPENVLYSPNAYKVPYLGLDGIFTLDPAETVPYNDPRNPIRIVVDKMEYFSFYKDTAGTQSLAQNCRYIYRGAAGDPYYFYKADPPAKTSIWDLFELAGGEDDACKDFYYVIVRAPHGNPVHMHLRYGNEESSFKKLLGNSTGPEDTTQLNPWWSVYCAAGQSGCDQ